MQLFSADARLLKKFAHEPKEKMAQKLLIIHNWIFSPYCPEQPIHVQKLKIHT